MGKRLKKGLKVREILKALGCFVLAFLSVGIFHSYVHFVVSETDSLPQHYFIHLPKMKPKKQDYTLVYSPWYRGNIIKQIIGVEGDVVNVNQKGEVLVNQKKVGIPYRLASDGSLLTPMNAQTIPKGYVFLYSPHPRGFDSRYQELGLVHYARLEGWVIPLGFGL